MMHNRRAFLKAAGLAIAGAGKTLGRLVHGPAAKSVQTPALTIAYEESGSAQGFPIILLHGSRTILAPLTGLPPPLVKAGHRVLVPYLRGSGPRVFAMRPRLEWRSRRAIGQDVVDFADALRLPRLL